MKPPILTHTPTHTNCLESIRGAHRIVVQCVEGVLETVGVACLVFGKQQAVVVGAMRIHLLLLLLLERVPHHRTFGISHLLRLPCPLRRNLRGNPQGWGENVGGFLGICRVCCVPLQSFRLTGKYEAD